MHSRWRISRSRAAGSGCNGSSRVMRSGEYAYKSTIRSAPQMSPTNMPRAVLLDTCSTQPPPSQPAFPPASSRLGGSMRSANLEPRV